MKSDRTMFGLPLTKPSKQAILPVVTVPTAQVKGYIVIPETVFTGEERTFNLQEGPVSITTVSLPGYQKVHNDQNIRLDQYVAVVYNDNDVVTAKPWLGYANFIDPIDSGLYHYWSMPVTSWKERLGLGNLVGFLVNGGGGAATSTEPQPPQVDNKDAEIRWVASLTKAAISGVCPMFDFNWYTMFKVHHELNHITGFQTPRTIDVDTVPPGFRVFTLYRANAVSGTNIFLDSLRILITDPEKVNVGVNTFEFTIHSEAGGPSVKATLEVNLVG